MFSRHRRLFCCVALRVSRTPPREVSFRVLAAHAGLSRRRLRGDNALAAREAARRCQRGSLNIFPKLIITATPNLALDERHPRHRG